MRLLGKELSENVSKTSRSILLKEYHSPSFQHFIGILRACWNKLLTITYFGYAISMIIDAGKLFIKYYAEIFIVYAISFPTVILLLNFFQNAPTIFFVAFLPILLCNLFLLSSLYYVISRSEAGERISLWFSLRTQSHKITQLVYVLLIQLSIFVLAGICFAIIAFILQAFFETIMPQGNGSFLSLFLTIFIGLVLLICIFILTVAMHQTFFAMLLGNKKFEEAFADSIRFMKAFALQFFIFYLLFSILASVVIVWASLYYLYLGFALSIFFFIQLSLHSGFLLRRRFYSRLTTNAVSISKPHKQLFSIIILFGLINYGLVSVVITKQIHVITSTIEAQRDNYFLSRELARYTNDLYRFTVQYPQNWNIYEWRGSSVTFYNNYTGTLTGGLWLNISVSPYEEEDFSRLYESRPGQLEFDHTTTDSTTKISNISIQGYEGVNYTMYKVKEPYPEYQTHYRIHKDNYIYDLTFTTLDKDVEGNNTVLFERIVGSFRFIE